MHDIGGAHIRVDRRGHWLLVEEGAAGVHVNGRPVRRRALLRAGDSVHVAGGAVLLAGPVAAAPSVRAGDADPAHGRMLLRAVGGRHHGRGFPLDRARVVGSDRDADIRLDPPVPARVARVACEQGRVVLRGIDGVASTVNGVDTRDAELRPGDQLLFGGRDRFVLEVPSDALAAIDDGEVPGTAAPRAGGTGHPPPRRLPWLLLAALLIAAALSALLLL